MNLRNLSVIVAVGAATLFPAANAGATEFSYLFNSGLFSYDTITGFSGTETVTLMNSNNSIDYGSGTLQLTGGAQTSPSVVSNVTAALSGFTPSSPAYGFTLNFLGGVFGPVSTHSMSGSFSGGAYASGALPGFSDLTGFSGGLSMTSADYQPSGGSLYNGSGTFGGYINLSAPELGTSAGMITMLMGAGFMNLRRRKKA